MIIHGVDGSGIFLKSFSNDVFIICEKRLIIDGQNVYMLISNSGITQHPCLLNHEPSVEKMVGE